MALTRLIVCFCLLAAVTAEPNCAELSRKGEIGIRKLILVDLDTKLPRTETEFVEYCNNGKKLYKGLREYKSCLKPLAQEMVGTVIKSIGKVLKKHCGDKEGRDESLRVLACAPDNTVVKAKKCTTQTLNMLDYMGGSEVSSKDVIPMACCMAHMTTECIREQIESTCTNLSVSDYFDNLVSSISKDVMELACEDYKTMKQCQQRIPASIQKLRVVANKPSAELASRQFVAPLLKIGEKLVD